MSHSAKTGRAFPPELAFILVWAAAMALGTAAQVWW